MTEPDTPRPEGGFLTDPVVAEPRTSILAPALTDPLIICPTEFQLALLTRMFKAKKALKPLHPGHAYTVKHQGHAAGIIGPCMGAPASVFLLERAVAAGVRNFIILGLCGSLHSSVRIGDLVVPIGARAEEGVTPHYMSGTRKTFPGERALDALKDAVAASGRSAHRGPIWTTDAVFRETRKKVSAYGERGLLAVEMESSALFTVARYRNVQLASILVVSDELFDLTWRTGFTRPRFLLALRHAARIALAAALKLAGKNTTIEPEPEPPLDEPSQTTSPETSDEP